MAVKTQQLDHFPSPFNTEGAQANVTFSPDGRSATISVTVDREAVRGLIDRWTWNEASIVIRSGDRDIAILLPKIKERPT